MSLDHPFMQGLRLNPEYADQYRRVINGVFHRHHHLVWGVFQQLHCMDGIAATISHPQWRTLLSIEDSTYTELVWEFYSTFQYRPKAERLPHRGDFSARRSYARAEYRRVGPGTGNPLPPVLPP
ncbi:unnamed protein product [Linum trigynum]|uniref:Uncharacterized protein n=1 Tax=Linum trigynum TaxID=586398 RepID=A0AAV2EZZ4_9ROSI